MRSQCEAELLPASVRGRCMRMIILYNDCVQESSDASGGTAAGCCMFSFVDVLHTDAWPEELRDKKTVME